MLFSLQDNDVRIVIAHFDVSLAVKVFCCVSTVYPSHTFLGQKKGSLLSLMVKKL